MVANHVGVVVEEALELLGQSEAQAPRKIDFEARELSYNNETETVTARGNVILRSEDRSVRADEVTWDRRSGSIIATGNT